MKTFSVSDYVKEGAVHGSIYTDPDVFNLEIKKIYESNWVYVAHESEIANHGDYKTTNIGSQPVIVARSADTGDISIMYNRCRHRASTVCQQDKGNANFFRCGFHGWTYANDGKLVGVPLQDGYGEKLDKQCLGLKKVAKVGSYRGFIFASLSEDVPSLEDHLGHTKKYLNFIADFGGQGIELTAGVQKYKYDANWKFQAENTIDPYHLSFVHKSYFDILSERSGQKYNFSQIHKEEKISDLGNGHSLYELAGDLGLGSLAFNLIIFPNLGIVGSQVRVIRPISVDCTEVLLYPFMLKGVSKEENAKRLRGHEAFYGPASFGTPDDIEMAFDRVRAGLEATGGEKWMIISRGMGRETKDENGILSSNSSDEVSTRAIYKAWSNLMV